MKYLVIALVLVTAYPASAGNEGRALRVYTDDQLRSRYNAERQRRYENTYKPGYSFSAPLGGYGSTLGQPAPRGTQTPGYVRGFRYDYEVPGYDGTSGLINGQ